MLLWQFAVFVPFSVFVSSRNARLHEKQIDRKVTRMSIPAFLSPVSKLLRFFCKSRDQWKAKCKVAKKEVNSLKIRLAAMKASRDRWKQRAREPVAVAGIASAQTNEPTTKNAAACPAYPSPRRRNLAAAGSRRGR